MQMIRHHEVNKLPNFIEGWYMQDFDLFDKILEFGKTDEERSPGVYVRDGQNIVDPSYKNSIDSQLQRNPELFNAYCQMLYFCLNQYGEKYKHAMLHPLQIIEPVNIQMYPANGGYLQFHCERGNGYEPYCNRHLVFMTYLNDVTEGGETEFLYQKLKVKPEKGLTLIWPPDFTHTHRGLPCQEEKSILTGWISYC